MNGASQGTMIVVMQLTKYIFANFQNEYAINQ